jgi:acetyltransferase
VDLWPAIERGGSEIAYGQAIKAVCEDPNVDAVFLHYYAGGVALNFDISAFVETARKSGKPMFCWLMGEAEKAKEFQSKTQALGVPVYRELYRAVECMAAAFEREKPESGDAGSCNVTKGTQEYLTKLHNSYGALDEHVSKKILAGYSIPTVEEKLVNSAEEAVSAARSLGFPVVMKGILPGGIHKTESGLVKLGISSEGETDNLFSDLKVRMEGKGKVLMQRQIKGGPELIAGFMRDPQFGPCVMIGLGGVFAEILKDTVFAVAPLSRREALSMIGRLKAQKLLNGYRGFAPVDRESLADIIVNLGELGCGNPKIMEIDINPLIAVEKKLVAVDATVVLQ